MGDQVFLRMFFGILIVIIVGRLSGWGGRQGPFQGQGRTQRHRPPDARGGPLQPVAPPPPGWGRWVLGEPTSQVVFVSSFLVCQACVLNMYPVT